MATEIERVIYKLEIDESAYLDGVDKTVASTKKLTDSQTAANAKLAELQKTQTAYKKSLSEITLILQANEKETIDLTKQLNALRDAGKGTSTEAIKLKNALRDTAVNTKELRTEAGQLKANLQSAGGQISVLSRDLKSADAANTGFTQGLSKTYGGLSRIAQLIPGMGIGGLVALIAGPVINAFNGWFDSMSKVQQQQQILGEAFTEGDYQKAIRDVDSLTLNIKLAKDGFLDKTVVLKEYNDTLGKSLGHVNDLDEAEDNLVKKGPAYIQMTLLKAAANLALDRAAKATLDATIELQESQEKIVSIAKKGESQKDKATGAAGLSEFLSKGLKNEADQSKREADKGIQNLKDIAEKFRKDAAAIAKEFKINFDPVPTPKPGKLAVPRKEIANIYEQELQKLKADIAKLDEKGFTDEASISKAVEEDFKKRALAFDKAFKNKQLTAAQVTSLKNYLNDLQKLTLDQNLKSFREQKDAYLKQITTELENLQFEEATKRISTIQDRFERERQLIIAETDKTVNVIEDKRDKLIADITKNAAKNGLTPADIAPQIERIKTLYSNLLDDLEVIKNQKLQQLSFDTFERLSEDAKRLLDSGNLGISQGSLINIQEQTKLYQEGKISFEQYQKELTSIAKFELNERFQLQKLFFEQEIKLRKAKLAVDKTLTDEQIKRLQDEIRRLEQELADATKGNIAANNSKPEKDDKIGTIVKYTQAIGDLTRQVVGFWAQVNAAELEALDRSISLQERRVNEAQKIAARGNAEYLKAEEDRLKQLQVQRENAARKQLGINAVLQGSEIIVALITGIAQGAKIGGPLGAIAGLAAIAGAIAGAFAIAESLKPAPPSFFVGTKDTGSGGRNDTKGGFNATLHPNEAVIPADRNKAYHPTVEAIYDKTIPAEHLNRFVKNYHTIKAVPQPNYKRIKEAAELNIGHDGRMSVLLTEHSGLLRENNELQREILRKKIHVENKIDGDGVSSMVTEFIEKSRISKRI